MFDNFDYGRFLGAAIESALGQTYPLRVTVVDDGSSNDSLAVARAYGDRIRLISKPNGGQAATCARRRSPTPSTSSGPR